MLSDLRGLPPPGPAEDPSSRYVAKDSPQLLSAQTPNTDTVPTVSSHGPPLISLSPFYSNHIIEGGPIIQNAPFFNAATVLAILIKLPEQPQSLPSINHVVLQVETNAELSRHLSWLKNKIIYIFNLLHNCRKSFFLSGLNPTPNRSPVHFSRILSLNTCLHFACRTHNITCTEKFHLFWKRFFFYGPKGLQLNHPGNCMVSSVFFPFHRHTLPRLCWPL